MWVDIANLVGPQGNPGKDGDKGDPGPVNIGLDPNSPIGWDQTGGFTFNFVDGSEQTVNLPIASAQSAGLLSAGGGLPSTGLRDISSLLSGKISSGTVSLIRVGPIVTVFLQRVAFNGSSPGYSPLFRLPSGFAPPTDIRENYSVPSESGFLMTVFKDGSVSTNQPPGDQLSRTLVFPTLATWPSTLPGRAA